MFPTNSPLDPDGLSAFIPHSPLTSHVMADTIQQLLKSQQLILENQKLLQEAMNKINDKLEGLCRMTAAKQSGQRSHFLPLQSVEEVNIYENGPAEDHTALSPIS